MISNEQAFFIHCYGKLFHMAMLAEPRFKRKISINPNGKDWSNDETKFGQKLLKKYGWTKGKGLGANEDGNPDHVKVDLKIGSKGVGYKHNHSDNWIAHQDDFNSILANLNEGNTEQLASVSSMESTSKKSKSRVHYQRFVQGKDLSKRSSSDLDSIFGVRKASKRKRVEEDNTECSEKSQEESLVTFTSSDSVQEYFAKKMAAKKNSHQQCQNDLKTGNEQDVIETEETSEKKRQKKKRKCKFEESEEREHEETEDKRVTFSLGDEVEESEVKIKKRKKNKDFEPVESTETHDNGSLHDSGVESVKKSKKSKKKRKEEKVSIEEQVLEENLEAIGSECVKGDKKEKRKSKKKEKHEKETERKKNEPVDKSEDFKADVKKSKKKESKQGELGDIGTTDGQAGRVVLDSAGNFDQVCEVQQSSASVKISEESSKTHNHSSSSNKRQSEDQSYSVKSIKRKTIPRKQKFVSLEKKKRKGVDWNNTPRTLRSHSGAVGTYKNENPRTGTNWNNTPRSFGSHSGAVGSFMDDREEKRRILEQDIKTKLPSIEDVFKVKGASMHSIGGVYEKPVKSEKEEKIETVKEKSRADVAKKRKARKLQYVAKKGGKTIGMHKSVKDSNKGSKKKMAKKTSNKPKALSEVEKQKIEHIRETTGITKTRHQLKKSLWYAKQRFRK